MARRGRRVGVWSVLTILGMHVVGIQAGTAMLDLVLCYLFLAALDSWLAGFYLLSALEFTFFFWSKPLVPLLIPITVGMLLVLLWGVRCAGFRTEWSFDDAGRLQSIPVKVCVKWGGVFLLASVLVGGPFLVKSFYYSGTPLFPIAAGWAKPMANVSFERLKEIGAKTDEWLENKNRYGHGKTWGAFFKHFWLIAVPESGVNNSYDYPIGLVYLLLLGPFFYYFVQTFRRKVFSILPWCVVLYWGFWWFGSQQSRFLFIPLILMAVLVLARIPHVSRALGTGILLSLVMVLISIYGAHKYDLGKFGYNVLREKDKKLLMMASSNGTDKVVELDFIDCAFAAFPVRVRLENSPFVFMGE